MSRKQKYLKFLMLGDDMYQDRTKIKDLIFGLHEKFGKEKVYLATLGKESGVDRFVKNDCMRFEMKYGEFPPYHQNHTLDCIMPEQRFGKQYDVRYYFWREGDAIKWSNVIMIFTNKKNINQFARIIKKAKNLDKKIKIFYDILG